MTQEEQRERVIQNIADMLRRNTFTCEFKVMKEPTTRIKVIYEVTQEQMIEMMNQAKQNWGKKKP